MMKFALDKKRSVESVTNFTLEDSMNTLIMQRNSALKDFDTFSREFIQLLLFTLKNVEVIELTIITPRIHNEI